MKKVISFPLGGILLAVLFHSVDFKAVAALPKDETISTNQLQRWSVDSTMRGANHVPSYAKNDVAIWMDYDPAVIDRELGYAGRLKLNTVRIFLNVAVYEHDPKQFLERLENFLTACDKYKIRAMPVLFDACFDPQAVNLKDYRDKSWIPSPGFSRLGEKDRPGRRRCC
jgi:hypothetical protein